MKKALAALLILLALSGCGSAPAAEPAVPPEEPPLVETSSLPETKEVKSFSAPAIVEEGRDLKAEDYELPPSPSGQADLREDFSSWFEGGEVGLLAELPETDAALYAPPYQVDSDIPFSSNPYINLVFLRWGESFAEFGWTVNSPMMLLPWMACFDVDGDGEDELIVDCFVEQATRIIIEELHIVEKNSDGTLTSYTLPESLWEEQVPTLFSAVEVNGRVFAILGRELVELKRLEHYQEGITNLEIASAGSIAKFGILYRDNRKTIIFNGAFCLEVLYKPDYLAGTYGTVAYRDGVFTIKDLHFSSYDHR